MEKYLKLLNDANSEKISLLEFEKVFLEYFKSENNLSDREFLILDKLFSDVDMYCPDNDLFEEGDLNDNDLRKSIESTVVKLLAIRQ